LRSAAAKLAKSELGTKRQCQDCGAKFFDLNKNQIVCPKCGTVFQGAAWARAAAKPKEEEAELAAAPVGMDTVSLDEVEADEEKVAEPAVDDIDVEEDADDGADHPLLEEEEEEDDDDVGNLIDGDVAPDDEDT
jgi:uncharacterized protein (TIGR02300 family)